jgi:peptide deformylase
MPMKSDLYQSGGTEIVLLGDQRLRIVCEPVADLDAPEFRQGAQRLVRTLERFRADHGFGRAISAPQIGLSLRMIAMNLGKGPFLLVNPELSALSAERFTMWDDCMSFPWLMVRLKRHVSADLRFNDEKGKPQTWKRVDRAVSELLQHEVDHLNGVLAIDHALDRDAIISRSVYEARRDFFSAQVDYSIIPTLP